MSSHKPPTWITDKFFKKVLGSSEGDKDIKVIKFTIESISKEDDTYASPIFRAIVDYSSKRTKTGKSSLILKVPSLVKSSYNSDDISFDTEIGIYSSILPEMHRLLKHSGDNVQIAPSVIFYSTEPNPVIVLEDITALLYDVPNTTLNLDDNLTAVWKLAKWHATSYYMGSDQQLASTYNSGLFNKKYSESLNFMLENLRYFTEEIKTWTGFSVYAEKFEALQLNFFKKGEQIFTAQSACNGFNVLNHGDFHFKNLMCKRAEDTEKLSIFFVDFQLSIWATPAIDLFYMLYMVASENVRNLYRNELILFYYKEFVGTLEKIGYLKQPPSLLDLHLELLKHGFLEVIIAVCFLPFLYGDSDKEFADSNNARKVIYSNPEYQTMIKNLLPTFLTKGFLD